MRILVTDAENRAALAVTRSLGRAGHHVLVAHHSHPTLASSSRYCRQRLKTANVLADPSGFVTSIADAVRTHGLDAIIPASDITTLTISRAVQDGIIDCRLCTPSFEDLTTASDKRLTLELAERLGMPVPRTVVIENAESVRQDMGLPFPLVIKPSRSRVWQGERWLFNAVSYAHSEKQLQETLQSLLPEQFPVLLQERIEGPGVGVFACYDHGRLIALFSHRRIREKPPSGGVSVLRESIPVDPEAGQHTRAILEALQWHGVAMVEFKLDQRDGRLKLMEINGRLWGSLQLAIDSGIDFPRIMACMLSGEKIAPITSYRVGVRTRWLWGDIDSLLSLFLKSRDSLNLPPDHPGRWKTLLHFLIPWQPGLHYEVCSLSDPRPWLYETRQWFRQCRTCG